MHAILVSVSLPAFLAAQPAPQEIATTHKDQQALAVTIYNDNLALVKDLREVKLAQGEQALAFQEVSAQIQPETALLRNLTHPKNFWVIEQNFDFDLLTPQKLLDKFVGQKVIILGHRTSADRPAPQEIREEAEVLATQQGTVLRFPDRIETSAPGRILFPKVPDNLRARPTLVITLQSPSESLQRLELSYLTRGLSWKADYVANLSPDEKTMDLSGWVTLTNQCGASFPNARLQLVAGDVNRVRDTARPEHLAYKTMKTAAPSPMQEESLFEYHLYTLDRPTTLKENQTKQVSLLTASSIPVRKEYLLRGSSHYYQASYGDLGSKLKVSTFLEFENRAESRMGMPLPKGTVRVYKRDNQGRIQFVGEDSVDHTPKHERVRLKLGEAFDLTAQRRQTDFKSLGKQGRYSYVCETAFALDLQNAKSEPITISVLEPIYGDWEIIQESHPHTKEAAGTARFQIPVPAQGKTTLTYRVRTRW